MRIGSLFILALLGTIGCAVQPNNPSFPLEKAQAERALSVMAEHPRPLARPLLLVGGFWDFHLSTPLYRWYFHRTSGDDRIVCVNVAFCGSFEECRRKLIEAVDEAFPNRDPQFTTEVDVVGASLGGLVARFAAAPSPDPAKPRRLRMARLFTVASPHMGATLAEKFGFTQFHDDMKPGSAFLEELARSDAAASYTVYPYVRLGDGIVGEENAAPPNQVPMWLPTPFFELSHVGAIGDPRILADIARRLRGEKPYAILPRTPLPEPSSQP